MRKRPASASGKEATPLYDRIRLILESARSSVARTVNTTQVVANWLIGREIVEEEQKGKKRAGYGRQLLEEISALLKNEFGEGYSVDNLELFRRFYLVYPHLISDALRRKLFGASSREIREISQILRSESAGVEWRVTGKLHAPRGKSSGDENSDAASRKLVPPGSPLITEVLYPADQESWQPGHLHPNLSWTHYRRLLRIEKAGARGFYEIEAIHNSWSARELERQINSLLYERLALSKDKKGVMRLATKGQAIQRPADVFKDPVVMEFLGLPESPRLVESDLEQALINNLRTFLLELGKGFAFVSRQERITLDGDHFYIDLVFYHTILKCFVLIDLKVGKLTHQDLGQLQLYVNYYDGERRTTGDNPTLGMILCTDKNDAVVRYTLGPDQQKKIFASRYKLYLPTEAELQAELRREVRQLFDSPKSGRKS